LHARLARYVQSYLDPTSFDHPSHRTDKGQETARLRTDFAGVAQRSIACDRFTSTQKIVAELREQAESIHGNQNLLGINQTIALADESLVACLPISIWTVRKPTKRTFEMISYYFMGQASTEELVAHVARLSKHDELTISDS
jgi:hypothetical protein